MDSSAVAEEDDAVVVTSEQWTPVPEKSEAEKSSENSARSIVSFTDVLHVRLQQSQTAE